MEQFPQTLMILLITGSVSDVANRRTTTLLIAAKFFRVLQQPLAHVPKPSRDS